METVDPSIGLFRGISSFIFISAGFTKWGMNTLLIKSVMSIVYGRCREIMYEENIGWWDGEERVFGRCTLLNFPPVSSISFICWCHPLTSLKVQKCNNKSNLFSLERLKKLLGARTALLEPAVRAVKSVCKLTRTSDERVLHPYDYNYTRL